MRTLKSAVSSVLNFLYLSLYPVLVGKPKVFTIWHKLTLCLLSGIYTFIMVQIVYYFAFYTQSEPLRGVFDKFNLVSCALLIPIEMLYMFMTSPEHT